MASLEGRVALVTGGGVGVGLGIARALAAEGARVAVHYASSAAGAEGFVTETVASGGEAIAIQGDLRHVADCERVVAATVDRFGALDLLVNNAGITRTGGLEDFSEQDFDDVFDLNIRSYFFCARAALPHLRRRPGSILNITSVHGTGGFAGHAAYAATKGAIIAFTRTLSIDLAPEGIRVNALAPGFIEVPRYFDDPSYTTAYGNRLVPLGRVGTPDDVGPVAAFLLSDAAGFITGTTLHVDGGTDAKMALAPSDDGPTMTAARP